MTQKWTVRPAKMKCTKCGGVSARMYKGYVENGAGKCPHCGTVHIASFNKKGFALRLHKN